MRLITDAQFDVFRKIYSDRLNDLKDEVLLITDEADKGIRGTCESLERMSEIDKEIRDIIECGKIINYLRS